MRNASVARQPSAEPDKPPRRTPERRHGRTECRTAGSRESPRITTAAHRRRHVREQPRAQRARLEHALGREHRRRESLGEREHAAHGLVDGRRERVLVRRRRGLRPWPSSGATYPGVPSTTPGNVRFGVRLVRGLRDAEVRQEDVSGLVEEDVARLDVPVDEAAGVNVVECPAISGKPGQDRGRRLSARRGLASLGERAAAEVLDHDEGHALVLAAIQDLGDPRVIQLRLAPDLVLEAPSEFRCSLECDCGAP